MQLKPHAGFVIAKKKKQSDITNLGFELPENYGNERNAAIGEVVAVGPDVTVGDKAYPTPELKPGQLFVYAPFSDATLRVGADESVVVQFKDVIGGFVDDAGEPVLAAKKESK